MAWIEKRVGPRGPRWKVCWDVEVDGETRQKSKSFDQEGLAKEFKRQLGSAQYRGYVPDIEAGKQLFGVYARNWLTTRTTRRGRLSPNTIQGYEGRLRRTIYPTFEFLPIGAIQAADVRNWYAGIVQDKGRNEAAKSYRILSAILATAESEGSIPANPCRIKGAGQEHYDERQMPKTADTVAIANAVHPRLHAFALLIAFGGLRPQEAYGLQRGDFDPQTRTVRIDRAATFVRTEEMKARGEGWQRIVGPTKSGAGKRTISLPSSVAKALAKHLEEFAGPGDEDWVFVVPSGRPIYPGWVSKEFTKARKALGLKTVPYDLRHHALTMTARTPGTTLKDIMERGGHSSMRAAIIYQHAAQEQDERVSDFLEQQLREATR